MKVEYARNFLQEVFNLLTFITASSNFMLVKVNAKALIYEVKIPHARLEGFLKRPSDCIPDRSDYWYNQYP